MADAIADTCELILEDSAESVAFFCTKSTIFKVRDIPLLPLSLL